MYKSLFSVHRRRRGTHQWIIATFETMSALRVLIAPLFPRILLMASRSVSFFLGQQIHIVIGEIEDQHPTQPGRCWCATLGGP